MKENLKPCVYTLSKHVKVQRRTFCRTVRRVMAVSEVKNLRFGAEGKPSVNCANKSADIDPKPGDLPMSRLKLL